MCDLLPRLFMPDSECYSALALTANHGSRPGQASVDNSQSAPSKRTEPTAADPVARQHLVNLETVSQRLAISKTSVYRMVARGTLPCYRLGGLLRFAEDDIESFLRKSRVG